ncbi:hypothetical protein [Sorangium sp. So ce341]
MPVQIGHTLSSYEEVVAVLAAGAKGFDPAAFGEPARAEKSRAS